VSHPAVAEAAVVGFPHEIKGSYFCRGSRRIMLCRCTDLDASFCSCFCLFCSLVGEGVFAYVTLKDGHAEDAAMLAALKAQVRYASRVNVLVSLCDLCLSGLLLAASGWLCVARED
jgi:acyl-CoA synthetase (AMP-forming)/AMP-acid ligase II